MKNEYLECGLVLRIHGLNGGLVVQHFCDSFKVFSSLKTLYFKEKDIFIPRKVKKVSFYKNNALVLIDGIDNADSAIMQKGKTLYAKREDLAIEDGSFFIADLIGLDVYDNITKKIYGKLVDVVNSGAQDIYVIKSDDGKESYIPVVKEFVKDISCETGIAIEPIEGMIS